MKIKDILEGTEATGYHAAGTVDTHGGHKDAGTKDFRVKYKDFPSHKDIKTQNPHLKDHEVDAIHKHISAHADDDYSDTGSEQHSGGANHDVYVKSNKRVVRHT